MGKEDIRVIGVVACTVGPLVKATPDVRTLQ